MSVIDRLCYQSRLRYVNAEEKFVYAILTLIFCVASRSFAVALIAFAANGILTVGKGGISLSRYCRLLLIPVSFLVVGTAAILVDVSEIPMDAFAFPVGDRYLTGSRATTMEALRVCAAAFSSATCLYFLALNTTMTDILDVLRKLRLPSLFIELMMLIYRFIFLLFETAGAIRISQESRLGDRNYRTKARSFGEMGSALFIRALSRSNSLYDAMESRGYDGKIRVLSQQQPPRKKKILMIAGFELILAVLTIREIWVRTGGHG